MPLNLLNIVFEGLSLSVFLFQLMEDNAVRLIHLHLPSVHDNNLLIHIHRKKRHGIRLVIQGNQMPVIRKQYGVLGIIAADGKAQHLGKQPALLVYGIEGDAVVSRIGAAQIFEIFRNIQCARRRSARMVIV